MPHLFFARVGLFLALKPLKSFFESLSHALRPQGIVVKKKHLVLVRQEGWIALDDFHEIQKRIERQAPDIKVFIANNKILNSKLVEEASKHPTLVVLPSQ
ncbi:MAG: hypothetical protein ACR2OR_10970 [Hyphomicrobiales bacterium]